MIAYPNINPVAFHVHTWPVYWYGLMYLVGFLGGWAVLALRIKVSDRGFTQDQLSDIVFYAAIGAIIGGRLGYVFFYDWERFAAEPSLILQTWKGGMSFHGGLLGVLAGMWLCSYKMKKPFLAITDLIAPAVPIGLGAGRIGNFINGELWGKITTMPWGMIFPEAGIFPRHPSMLYEFLLEGVVMFLILWIYSRKPRPLGAVSGLFALCYGVFRFVVEFFRVPDPQIGYIAMGWLTQGQLLSIPLILIGELLLVRAYKRQDKQA
jgi:phosphatidylglycerol---prolipoprotein diacylglyceryl transferase